MPGSMPATSQLDWLSSTTAMIVLFWSRATRDLLKSFGWGIRALHRLHAATKLPFLAARPIASSGSGASGEADAFLPVKHRPGKVVARRREASVAQSSATAGAKRTQ